MTVIRGVGTILSKIMTKKLQRYPTNQKSLFGGDVINGQALNDVLIFSQSMGKKPSEERLGINKKQLNRLIEYSCTRYKEWVSGKF